VPAGQTLQFALGFDQRVAGQIELGWRLYQPVSDPAQVALSWAYSKDQVEPLAWPPVGDAADATGSLQRDGSMRLTPPGDWTAQRATGPAGTSGWTTVTAADGTTPVTDPLFWVGLRLTNAAAASLTIGIDRLLFNAALARTALTTRTPEILGQSTGEPFQVFQLSNRPLFRRPGIGPPYADLVVQVGTGVPPAWQDWTLVDDLPPGPGQVYRANPVTGEISFGNYDDQTKQGHGSVPPAGSQIRAAAYRYVSTGEAGNVAAGQVTVLGTTRTGALPAGITSASNLGPGQDGADDEPVEDTLRRAPQELKIRDRAVTADDYEFLAGEASNEVAIRRCLPPRLQDNGDPWTYGGIIRAPGNVNVIIVPDQGPLVARPEPTQDLLRQVRAYLDNRRDLTVSLAVLGPRYLPVTVSVDLVMWQQAVDAGADQAKVQADTLDKIRAFLHPTRGGPSGTGWQIGQPVFTSDLFQAIMPASDLGYISALQVKPDTAAGSPPRPFEQPDFGASVRVADYELVCAAASHTVRILPAVPI
jgi:predicted phage baseplate assembly protein